MNKKETERQIVYNGLLCKACSKTIVSRHRHDYNTCGCSNEASIDGGLTYLHYGAENFDLIELITVYADDPFEKVRQHATRGSRGKSGKEPLVWIKLSEMTDEHLAAVLSFGGAEWHLKLIAKELQYRHENNISIKDPET
jgi:hypothetical protein